MHSRRVRSGTGVVPAAAAGAAVETWAMRAAALFSSHEPSDP